MCDVPALSLYRRRFLQQNAYRQALKHGGTQDARRLSRCLRSTVTAVDGKICGLHGMSQSSDCMASGAAGHIRHVCIWSELGQRHLSEAPAALNRAASNESAQQLRGRQANEHPGGCL